MTWGCQAGVETANLITVMKNYKITTTESYESIKLGIDAHAKWYYVARQLDGATPQPVQKMDFESLYYRVRCFIATFRAFTANPATAAMRDWRRSKVQNSVAPSSESFSRTPVSK